MRRHNFLAIVLIVFGLLLILNQFDLIYFSRLNIFITGSAFLGIVLLNKGFNHPMKKGILGGSFFVFFAVILVFMRMGFLPINDQIGTGIIFVLLGLANIIYFLVYPKKTANIIFAILFLLLGLPFLLTYYDVLSVWMVEDYFITYWPALLIIFGLGLLIDGMLKRKQKTL